jgi:uncharacterized membrane protein
LLGVRVLNRFEVAVGWQGDSSPETARLVMSTVAASTFTLVVLLSSVMLLAIQLSSAQITPRIIAMIYRSHYGKLAFAIFVFSFTFSMATLVRIEDTVPHLTCYVSVFGFLVSLVLFILFIDSVGKTLRPSSALRRIGLAARKVIRSVYPSPLRPDSQPPQALDTILQGEPRIVLNTEDGAVLAFNRAGLINKASKSNCIIELIPQVGDFVAAGDPMFRIYGGGNTLPDRDLRGSIAVGHERNFEQDSMFAFRIIVDIAIKALSPAINDPTTAVIAIDQLHHLLRDIGKRYLAEGQEKDAAGQLRLIYRTPDWEDFVLLGTTEIRQYGRDSIQVQRRLRAMLEDLIETLPESRHAVLQKETALLGALLRRAFADVADQALAESGDLQGIGGSDDELYEGRQTPLVRHVI